MKTKTTDEIKKMREGGKILAAILKFLAEQVKPGIKTIELENFARKLISEYDVKSSFLSYQNFPAVLCVSVNDEVVHGVPSNRILQQGDIVGLDLGIWYKNLVLDAAITVGVGKISKEAKKLIKVTRASLDKALTAVRAGATVGDIGSAIQKYVEDQGFSVVRELVGHGVGYEVHESPQIPNYGKSGTGIVLPENLVIAIEPMVTSGSGKVKLAKDGFAYKTVDDKLAAHFEVTAAVTKKGAEVLTPL